MASEIAVDSNINHQNIDKISLSNHWEILFEESPDAIILFDRNGKIISVNSAITNYSGYSKKYFIGKHFSKLKLLHKKDIPKYLKIYRSLLKGEEVEQFEFVYRHKNSEDRWADIKLKRIDTSNGIFILAILRDITESKLLQNKILESENKWKSLFELAPDGIVMCDFKGFIRSANSAFFKLTGYREDEIIGKHFSNLGTLRLRDTPKYLKLFESMIRGKIIEPVEFDFIRKDGTIGWAEAHVKIVKINNKKNILGILRDITNRKMYEKKIEETIEQLKSTNQELDDYTYVISHDLKAPLRTIMSFSNFLIEDYSNKLDDTGKEYLERMVNSSNRMAEMIDELLLISRVGRKDTNEQLVNLNELVDEIVLDMNTLIEEKKGEIIRGFLPVIVIQKVWFRQILSNLINNGLKFNESDKPTIWIDCEVHPEHYLFSVKDNGIGIEEKYQEKIFKIFQRLHPQDKYPGSGAGLTICKKIVEHFGGKIWVESKPGKGSTFYFTHPKDISNKEDESEVYPEVDQSMIQVEEETPVHIK